MNIKKSTKINFSDMFEEFNMTQGQGQMQGTQMTKL